MVSSTWFPKICSPLGTTELQVAEGGVAHLRRPLGLSRSMAVTAGKTLEEALSEDLGSEVLAG